MACSASSGVAISTKPKPRDRPVSRSVTTLADSTLPVAAKASRRRSFEVENERPPTKSLTAMEGLLLPSEPVRVRNSERRSGTRPDGEEGSRRTDDRTRQPKYTLVNNLRYRLLPEVRSGRDVHRASQVRRAFPRAPGRRIGCADTRRGADRRRGPPVAVRRAAGRAVQLRARLRVRGPGLVGVRGRAPGRALARAPRRHRHRRRDRHRGPAAQPAAVTRRLLMLYSTS